MNLWSKVLPAYFVPFLSCSSRCVVLAWAYKTSLGSVYSVQSVSRINGDGEELQTARHISLYQK